MGQDLYSKTVHSLVYCLTVLQCDSTWNSECDTDSDDVTGVNPVHDRLDESRTKNDETNRKTTETTSLLVVTG